MQTVEARFIKKKNLQNHFKSYIAKLIYQEFGNVLYQGRHIYMFVSISSTNVNLIMNKTLII